MNTLKNYIKDFNLDEWKFDGLTGISFQRSTKNSYNIVYHITNRSKTSRIKCYELVSNF